MNRIPHPISRLWLALALLLLCGCNLIHAQVPRTLNYQGYLTSPSGAAINNASQAMTIKIYDAPTAGNLLFTELQTVTVSNGIFNLLIGSVTALPLAFDKPYWIGVTVGTDPEMSPRQPLAASPYAIRSASSESLAASALIAPSNLPAVQLLPTVACATNQIPQWNGSAWICATASSGSGTVTNVTASAPLASTGGAAPNLSLGPISLAGDVTGTQGATVVSMVSGVAAASVASGATLANAATSANTAGIIVRRDVNGNFAGATISGNLTGSVTGNATTATKLANTRSINGVAFDGTADIALPIYGAIAGTFTQPAVGSNTPALVVSSSAWMTVGQVVFVGTGGYYQVFSTPDTTHVVLTNLGYAGNTVPSSTGNGGAVSSAGPVGASGLKSLIALATEPAGTNCAYGGSKVTSGLDINANGNLDPGEVSATGYACNGTPYAVVPVVPAGCGTQALSLATPVYVSPAGVGGVVYRGDAVTFSVNVTDPNTCNSVTVANNYIWTLVSKPLGSTATLSSTTSATPTLVADVAGGSYQMSVQVIDTLGNKSPTASVTINVSACGAQAPVILSVNAPPSVYTSLTSQLGVTASSPDNQNGNSGAANYCPPRFAKTLGYQWSIANAPAGGNGQLSGLAFATPTFSAGTVAGNYVMRVVVTDNSGLSSAPVTSSINVSLCGTAALSWPPVNAVSVSASDPDPSSPVGQTNVGAHVALTPAVNEPNVCPGAPVTQSYQWALQAVPTGSTVNLVVDATGVARFVPDKVGTYQFQVTATDSLGNASPLYNTSVLTSACGANPVSVVAQANGATLPAGSTLSNEIVILAGSSNGIGLVNGSARSNDNDSTQCPARFAKTFSYAWNIVNSPPGSTAQLTNANGTTTTFLAGATPGHYQVQVVASTSTGLSSPPSYVFFLIN